MNETERLYADVVERLSHLGYGISESEHREPQIYNMRSNNTVNLATVIPKRAIVSLDYTSASTLDLRQLLELHETCNDNAIPYQVIGWQERKNLLESEHSSLAEILIQMESLGNNS